MTDLTRTPVIAHENAVAEAALAVIRAQLTHCEFCNLVTMWVADRGMRSGMKLSASSAKRFLRFGLVTPVPGERGVYTTSELGAALALRG